VGWPTSGVCQNHLCSQRTGPDASPEEPNEESRHEWIEALLQLRQHEATSNELPKAASEESNADGRTDFYQDHGGSHLPGTCTRYTGMVMLEGMNRANYIHPARHRCNRASKARALPLSSTTRVSVSPARVGPPPPMTINTIAAECTGTQSFWSLL